MSTIYLLGLGPGGAEHLPPFNRDLLLSGRRVFLRTLQHPVLQTLERAGTAWESFDTLYEQAADFETVYEGIVTTLLAAAREEEVVYAVPGHPLVAERTGQMLLERAAQDQVVVCPAMSCLDALYSSLRLDPARGTVVLDALELEPADLCLRKHHLILQVYNRRVAGEVKLALLERCAAETMIRVVRAAGVAGEERQVEIPLFELDRLGWLDHLTSVYLPAGAVTRAASYPLDPLVEVMARLRGEDGCPWDREQTHLSLRPYVIEEAYEVAEAIERQDMYNLREELGDLLLQVVFHAQLAAEAGAFDVNDVVAGITGKMWRRHPHVFGTVRVENARQVEQNWEAIKAEEKGGRGGGLDAGIPRALPALQRATRVQERAAGVGFDWEDAAGPRAKVEEELGELDRALSAAEKEAELGDLLFAVVNLARFLRVDAEAALHRAVRRFTRRFDLMEAYARRAGQRLADMDSCALDKLWQQAKREMAKDEIL